MSKLDVCVIFGGVSSEHKVSLVSAATVAGGLDREKYNLHLIGITEDGGWRYVDGDKIPADFDTDFGKYPKAVISPDRGDSGILIFRGEKPQTIECF